MTRNANARASKLWQFTQHHCFNPRKCDMTNLPRILSITTSLKDFFLAWIDKIRSRAILLFVTTSLNHHISPLKKAAPLPRRGRTGNQGQNLDPICRTTTPYHWSRVRSSLAMLPEARRTPLLPSSLERISSAKDTMTMISVSLRQLVDFSFASPHEQRKLLRDIRDARSDGYQPFHYYRRALVAILRYHRRHLSSTELRAVAASFDQEAAFADARQAACLRYNARCIRTYLSHFAHLPPPDIDRRIRLRLQLGQLTVAVAPDLAYTKRGRTNLVRFEFREGGIAQSRAKAMVACLGFAADQAGIRLSAGSCQVWDLATGELFAAGKPGVRLRRQLESSAQNLVAIWNSLEPITMNP